MESWKIPTIILCLYGFFKSMKPSESFLEPFLVGTDKNLTKKAVNDEIFPVWTYSYLTVLIPVFLMTDLLRYKSVIVLEAFSYIATWALLIWAQGILPMQFMQFFYGIATATEIAYFSYIFAVVPQEKYKFVSGCVRAMLLVSKCLAGVLGQVLISMAVTDYLTLNIISFVSVSISALFALCLPHVKGSTVQHQWGLNEQEREAQTTSSNDFIQGNESGHNDYHLFNNHHHSSIGESNDLVADLTSGEASLYSYDLPYDHGNDNIATIDASSLANVDSIQVNTPSDHTWQCSTTSVVEKDKKRDKTCTKSLVAILRELFRDFVASYSNKTLLLWSIWWAIASCGDFQVLNYAQNLWDVVGVNRTEAKTFNGAVDATSTLIGAVCALAISLVPANWEVYGELLLAAVSIANSGLLITMATTTSIWIAYVFYGLFRAGYQTVITVATFQIAKHLEVQRYGLVYGFNTFMALVLQTILTVLVIDKRGLDVGIRVQFIINGGYFGVMGVILLVAASVTLRRRGCVPCRDVGVPLHLN